MLTFLESRWPLISIFLLLVLLAALVFFPPAAGTLAIVILLLSVGMSIFLVVNRQIRAYCENKIDRAVLARNIFVEIVGILLAIVLALFFAQLAIRMIASLVGGGWLSIVIALLTAILVGMGVNWLIKVTWGRLAKLKPISR